MIVIVSCSKYETIHVNDAQNNNVQNEIQNTRVTIDDVYGIVKRDFSNVKSSVLEDKFTIIPYTGNSLDTLMYIVNFGNNSGWQIYSSDKRIPAILARGDVGHFTLNEGSPAVAIWMNHLEIICLK